MTRTLRALGPRFAGGPRAAPARAGARRRPRGDANVVLFTALALIMLAFFILLFALSSPKSKSKQTEMALEIARAFESIGGVFTGPGDSSAASHGGAKDSVEVSAAVESLLSDLQGYTESNEELEDFSYIVTNESIRVNLPSDFTFSVGSAEISPKALELLEHLYEMVARTENRVRVEGHTDNLPHQSDRFADNWELSAARALAVVRHMLDKGDLPAERFQAAGYGSERPVASNRHSEGRGQNRRVSVVLIGPVRQLGGPLGTGK